MAKNTKHKNTVKKNQLTPQIVSINIKNILPDNRQPRYTFNEKSLDQLMESIKNQGVLNPVLVEPIGNNKFKILAGERRFRAVKKLGKTSVDCIIKKPTDDLNRIEIQLTENLQRDDLTPVEKAKAIISYKNKLGNNVTWSVAENKLGISESRRKQLIRLLNLPTEIQNSIVTRYQRGDRGKITEYHARALWMLSEKPEEQMALFREMTRVDNPISGKDGFYKAHQKINAERGDTGSITFEYDSREELIEKLTTKINDIQNGVVSNTQHSGDSKIEWTHRTWNVSTGCTKVSAGCINCYAEGMIKRNMQPERHFDGFKFTMHPEDLLIPHSWNEPRLIFVDSMSDLFHNDMEFEFIDKVMQTITDTKRHVYQILTKRPQRMLEYFNNHQVPNNAWIGVTVENRNQGVPRIDILRQINARVRFISAEPLLEDLGDLNLNGIHWVIVGGESGIKARPTKKEWILNIKEHCTRSAIPFFFKQWGTYDSEGEKLGKHNTGSELEGNHYKEFPLEIRNTLIV